jgi:hypothetical protein
MDPEISRVYLEYTTGTFTECVAGSFNTGLQSAGLPSCQGKIPSFSISIVHGEGQSMRAWLPFATMPGRADL